MIINNIAIGCVDGDTNDKEHQYNHIVSCKNYYKHPEECGKDDTENFKAYEICCACKKKAGEGIYFSGVTNYFYIMVGYIYLKILYY